MLIRAWMRVLGAATAATLLVLLSLLLWGAHTAERVRSARDQAHARALATVELAAAAHQLQAGVPPRDAGLEVRRARLDRALAELERSAPGAAIELAGVRELLEALDGEHGQEAHAALLGAVHARIDRVADTVLRDVRAAEEASSAETTRAIGAVRSAALWIGAASVLLLAMGALFVLVRLERGLSALHAGAIRMQGGELARPVGLAGSDELALLGKALDDLAADLRETVVSRDRLEELVSERTAALEASRAELARRVEELSATRVRLDTSDRLAAVGRLSRGLAHELNNPLAIVRANVEFALDELGRGSGAPGEAVVALDEASAATQRMAQIVRDLSAFAREPGDDQGPADLREVLERVVRILGAEVGSRGRLELQAPPGPLLVRGSASALAHVFSRLVLDAAAAYPPGTPPERARVRVSAWRGGTEVIVEVTDEGRPIPPEILPHVFDPFFEPTPGFTAGLGGRGTGVSLSAVYGLVEGVGGAVAVRSDGRQGTVFRVVLRVATSDTRLNLSARSAARSRPRVLVVHEDALALASLYGMLSDRVDVVPHTSPRHVLTLLGAGERFDAVVCDASLREVEPGAFVAGLTAAAPALASATLFLLGAAGTVPEPLRGLPNPTVAGPPGPALLEALSLCLAGADRTGRERATSGWTAPSGSAGSSSS